MRILVIKPSSLGDIIHGLQVVAIIKRHLPDVTIDWVVRDCWEDVIRASKLVNKIFLFYRHEGIRKFFKLIHNIRRQKYDAVLDMQGLARTGVLTYLSRAARKIGRWDAREFSRLAYNEIIERPQGKHAIDILLQFLPKLGIPANFEACLTFQLPDSSIAKLSKSVLPRYVLLFPESRRAEKQWPYFVQFAEKFASKYEAMQFIIVGQTAIDVQFKSANILNLTGRTSMMDVLRLIQNCSLLVANDSAPIHIGAAMKKPIIAFFGPTDPSKFGPYPVSANDHVIVKCDNLPGLIVDEAWDVVSSKIDKFLHDD